MSARAGEAGGTAQPLEGARVAAIFARAARRGREAGLPYAGAVTPAEAWALVRAQAAILVDVRTKEEWQFVGHVPGAPLVEWRRNGEAAPDPRFLDALGEHVGRDEPVLFLCRSGVRSHDAAELTARAGLHRAYNVLEGFEGALDGERQRGKLGGWRHAGLPWVQS